MKLAVRTLGLALLPLFHRRVPTMLCEPLDAVRHGLSCISAQRFNGSGVEHHGVVPHITKHRNCLFAVRPTRVAHLRAAQAAHPSATSVFECAKKLRSLRLSRDDTAGLAVELM